MMEIEKRKNGRSGASAAFKTAIPSTSSDITILLTFHTTFSQ